MSKEEIFSILSNALCEEFEIDIEKFTPTAKIKNDLSLDSLDIVDVVVIIENNFHIKLKSNDFVKIITFSELVEFIFNHQNEKK